MGHDKIHVTIALIYVVLVAACIVMLMIQHSVEIICLKSEKRLQDGLPMITTTTSYTNYALRYIVVKSDAVPNNKIEQKENIT